MAAYTDNHHSYCNHLSLSSGLTSGTQHQNQEVSISELIEHGSVSFGRFTAESLAWEKWSVFSHNRCQEELEKFKAPGLVAQKKAYFEEYYKKIRAMKKLQAEQQEFNKSELSQGEKDVTLQVEKGSETNRPEKEKNSNDSIQTQFLETIEDKSLVAEEQGQNPNDNTINKDEFITSSATFVDEEQGQKPNDNSIDRDETKTSSATVVDEEQGHNPNVNIINRDEIKTSSATGVDMADQVPVLPIKTCLKSSLQDSCVSGTVKLNANRPNRASLLKAKGTVTPARDKTKLDNRTKRDATKPSEKKKSSPGKDTSGRSTTTHALSGRPNPKLARNQKSNHVTSHRPSAKALSSATLSQTSVLKDRPTSSSSVRRSVPKGNLNSTSVLKDRLSSSYSVRSGAPKANLNAISILKDRPTSSYSVRGSVPKANLNSTSVLKDRPSSSYSVRSGAPKANLNSIYDLKDRPITSSHSTRTAVPKANLNSKGSMNKAEDARLAMTVESHGREFGVIVVGGHTRSKRRHAPPWLAEMH
ncbi:hypothetical protein LguiA_011225 [Lonicera macranthoides]